MTIHVNVGGTWRDLGSDHAWARVGTTHRSIAEGHLKVSGTWRQFYLRDVIGPGAATSLSATFGQFDQESITWTNPADADFYRTVITGHRGSSLVASGTFYGAPSQTLTATFYIPGLYEATSWFITTYDTNGNEGASAATQSMAWTGAARGRYPSPYYFDAAESGTYVDATGSPYQTYPANQWYLNDVIQGWDRNSWRYIGAFMWGDRVFDSLRGAAVIGASLQVARKPTGGSVWGIVPYMWWSELGTKSGNPPIHDGFQAFYYPLSRESGTPSYATIPLPSNWYAPLTNPASTRLKSIVFRTTDTHIDTDKNTSIDYMEMYGRLTYGLPVVPGRLIIEHTG